MSRMSDINLEIMEYLDQGIHPVKIARVLKVPLTWVYDTLENKQEHEPTYDPYNTINS
jgi:hypothetical protein